MTHNPMLPQNKQLEPLSFLIGNWNVTMKHIAIPEPLSWQDTFSWLDNGFIVWHWQGKNEVPQATLIIGRNEETGQDKFNIFYYDARGISRCMHMSFENRTWKFWRNGADFYQRMEYVISDDKMTLTGHGEISEDRGMTWNHDFSIEYTKAPISK